MKTKLSLLLVFLLASCSSVHFRSPVTFENELQVLNRMHKETMRQAERNMICEFQIDNFFFSLRGVDIQKCVKARQMLINFKNHIMKRSNRKCST